MRKQCKSKCKIIIKNGPDVISTVTRTLYELKSKGARLDFYYILYEGKYYEVKTLNNIDLYIDVNSPLGNLVNIKDSDFYLSFVPSKRFEI